MKQEETSKQQRMRFVRVTTGYLLILLYTVIFANWYSAFQYLPYLIGLNLLIALIESLVMRKNDWSDPTRVQFECSIEYNSYTFFMPVLAIATPFLISYGKSVFDPDQYKNMSQSGSTEVGLIIIALIALIGIFVLINISREYYRLVVQCFFRKRIMS